MRNQNRIMRHVLSSFLCIELEPEIFLYTERNILNTQDCIDKRAITKIVVIIRVFVCMDGVDQYVRPADITMENLVLFDKHPID